MPSSDSDDEPVLLGAQRVWFGKHQGDRFDTVLESYKAWATHPQRSQAPWYGRFLKLHKAYDKWYMKNKKNPGNVEIWWGKTYKGHEIRKVYQAPRYMRWLLSRDNEERSWSYRVAELRQLYKRWLKAHPRPYRRRQRTEQIVDFGESAIERYPIRNNAQSDEEYDSDFVTENEGSEGEETHEEEEEEAEAEAEETGDSGEDSSALSTGDEVATENGYVIDEFLVSDEAQMIDCTEDLEDETFDDDVSEDEAGTAVPPLTPRRSPRKRKRGLAASRSAPHDITAGNLCQRATKASIPGRDTDASGSASYLNLVNRPDDDVRVTEATPRRPRSARKPSNASRRTPASVPSSSDDSEVEVLTTASLKRRRSKRLRGQHPHDSDGDSQAMVSPTVKEPNSLRVDKPSDLTPRTPLRHLRKSSKAPPVIPDSDEDDNEPGQQNLVGGTSRVLALDHRPEKHAETHADADDADDEDDSRPVSWSPGRTKVYRPSKGFHLDESDDDRPVKRQRLRQHP